jgi:hypothetical protein
LIATLLKEITMSGSATPVTGGLGDYQPFLDYQKAENLKLQAFMVQSKAEENRKEAALQAARSATFK